MRVQKVEDQDPSQRDHATRLPQHAPILVPVPEITKAGEEEEDHLEAGVGEGEKAHVPAHERLAGRLPPRLREKRGRQIEAQDLTPGRTQRPEKATGATGDLEDRPGPSVTSERRGQAFCLTLVAPGVEFEVEPIERSKVPRVIEVRGGAAQIR